MAREVLERPQYTSSKNGEYEAKAELAHQLISLIKSDSDRNVDEYGNIVVMESDQHRIPLEFTAAHETTRGLIPVLLSQVSFLILKTLCLIGFSLQSSLVASHLRSCPLPLLIC